MKVGDLLTEKCRTYKRSPVAKTKARLVKKKVTFEDRIEAEITKIFYECNSLHVDVVGRKLTFELGTQTEVKFEKLKQLSDLLGTLELNFTGYKQYDGGCESCGWGAPEDKATIETWDVSTDFFDRMSAPARG